MNVRHVECSGSGLAGTASTYSALLLGKAIGFDRLFFGYAALNFLIAVFVFCLVPETAGKTLKDIQQ
jgi:hypothetical protein